MRIILLSLMAVLLSGHAAMLRADVSVPTEATSMTSEQLEDFFTHQKKGTPVLLTLEKGKVIKGLFSSYDDYYETVWIIPREGEKGVFSQKGYKLSGVRNVTLWDNKATSSGGFAATSSSGPVGTTGASGWGDSDYYLLKKDGE